MSNQFLTNRKPLLWIYVFLCNTDTVYMMPVIFNDFLTFPELNVPTSLDSNSNSNNFLSFWVFKIRKHTFWNCNLIKQNCTEDFTSLKSYGTEGTCSTAIHIKYFQFWMMASWIQKYLLPFSFESGNGDYNHHLIRVKVLLFILRHHLPVGPDLILSLFNKIHTTKDSWSPWSLLCSCSPHLLIGTGRTVTN